MSRKELKIVDSKPATYDIHATAIAIRDQFQKAGYMTSFTQHFAKRPKGTYPELLTSGSLVEWSADVHCGKTIVCIYELNADQIAVSLYSPLSAYVINQHFNKDEDVLAIVEEMINHFPVEATLFVTETSTEEEIQAQVEFLSYRRPTHPYNPVSKPLTEADIQEAIRGLTMDGLVLPVGAETEFNEQNEDADLNRLADEREGQPRVAVDVETL